MPYPGSAANAVLRIVGALYLIGSAISGIATWEASSGFGDLATSGRGTAAMVLAQGVVVSCILFALAGAGDNLIAIREAIESEDPLGGDRNPT